MEIVIVKSSRNNIALSAVCLSAVMLGLEITSIPSILPTIERVLPADFKQLQWIMNAYTLAMCSTLIAMGALADSFGRKRVFIIGISVFGISSLICGLAFSAPLLIVARFLQGISAAGMLACQVAVLSHQYREGKNRVTAFAWWGIVFGLGLGLGPIVGGAIIAFLSWKWVFLIHVLIAIITVILARIGVSESVAPHDGKTDIGGMVTLPIAVFGLVYLITQGQTLSLSNPLGLAILCSSLSCLLLFVFIENRATRPIFDLKAFQIRNFSGALLGASGMNFSFWPFIIYFPIYLQSVLGYSSVMAGLTVLAYTFPTVIVPPYAERLLVKRGPKFVIPLGLLVIAGGFMFLHLIASSDYASLITLLPGCLLAGIGLGLTNTTVTNTTTASLPPERTGMASGMEFSARMISLAINIAFLGFILLKGVQAGLTHLPSDSLSVLDIAKLADVIAAGNLSDAQSVGITASVARHALTHGFEWVTLYGAVAPAILAVIARWKFSKKKKMACPAVN